MNLKNKLCPICKISKVKNFYAKSCIKCRSFLGNKNPNFKGKSICNICGNKCDRHSKKNRCLNCYKKTIKGLPKCKKCGNNIARYKPLNGKISTGYCGQCYYGSITKRWNNNLTQEERENGRTINPDYRKWRISVFERDDYTCQKCGDNKGGNLVAHHIESYQKNKELRVNLKNGVTLCKKCHIGYHKKYGWKNSNLLDFNNYIK